jgi:ubiquinone/menaquinone biosynthesis C-methylase UbiE
MLYKKKSIRFNNEQTHKYSNSRIAGTGYLAFRDIEIFCLLHKINFSKVLDLGCGAGRSTKFLANHCGYIVGTDISKEMLALAANVMPELNFYLNDDADKYKLSPFSAIFSILMFFHFSNIEDMKAELQKC